MKQNLDRETHSSMKSSGQENKQSNIIYEEFQIDFKTKLAPFCITAAWREKSMAKRPANADLSANFSTIRRGGMSFCYTTVKVIEFVRYVQ